MEAGVTTPWQTLRITFAITPLGHLHKSSPSPIPWDQACGKPRPRSRRAPQGSDQNSTDSKFWQVFSPLVFPTFSWNQTSRDASSGKIGRLRRPISNLTSLSQQQLEVEIKLTVGEYSFYWNPIVGIPKTRGLIYSPWKTTGIPSAITPLGLLYQSPPLPIPGDRARGKRRGFSLGAAARQKGAVRENPYELWRRL